MRRVRKEDLRHVAKATGATVVRSFIKLFHLFLVPACVLVSILLCYQYSLNSLLTFAFSSSPCFYWL